MKALLSREPGGPETLMLDDLPDPVAPPGLLSVRVEAAAINFPDVLIIEDRYQMRPARPFAPGGEIAGTVTTVGDGVSSWAPGDRLIAAIGHGGLAEQALVPAAAAIPIADDDDAIEASALLYTYGTAIHALVDRGALAAGETLLVLGGAGGVGLAAVEIGKELGATVVAAVSTTEKAAAAAAAGADQTLVYPAGPFDKDGAKALAAAFKDAVGGHGADVIVDPVGGPYTEPALRAAAWEGRHLVIGFPAGIPTLPLNLTLLKSCDVRGVFWGAFAARDPAANRAHVERLLGWWRAGRIRPRIEQTWPLAEGGAAIAHLAARRAIGKLVVVPGRTGTIDAS